MKYSLETFIQQTNLLVVLTHEVKQRLSSMRSSMEQEMQKSEVSLEELLEMVSDLRRSSCQTRHLLEHYERELAWHLEEVMFSDWIGDESMYVQNTRH